MTYDLLVLTAFIIYDFILNVGDEIQLIWGRKSSSWVLLLLNRLSLTMFAIMEFPSYLFRSNISVWESAQSTSNSRNWYSLSFTRKRCVVVNYCHRWHLTPQSCSCASLTDAGDSTYLSSACISAGQCCEYIHVYLTYFSAKVVAALRMYAVSRRNRYLAIITLALAMVPVGTNLVSILFLYSGSLLIGHSDSINTFRQSSSTPISP